MQEPFGGIVKPVKTMDRIFPGEGGRLSLKSEPKHEEEEARRKCREELAKEGLLDFLHIPGLNFPSDLEFKPAPKKEEGQAKITGMSDFAQSAYEGALDVNALEYRSPSEQEEDQNFEEVPLNVDLEQGWKPVTHQKVSCKPLTSLTTCLQWRCAER